MRRHLPRLHRSERPLPQYGARWGLWQGQAVVRALQPRQGRVQPHHRTGGRSLSPVFSCHGLGSRASARPVFSARAGVAGSADAGRVIVIEQMRALDGEFHRLSTDDEAMRREISRDSEQLRRAQVASATGGGVV